MPSLMGRSISTGESGGVNGHTTPYTGCYATVYIDTLYGLSCICIEVFQVACSHPLAIIITLSSRVKINSIEERRIRKERSGKGRLRS